MYSVLSFRGPLEKKANEGESEWKPVANNATVVIWAESRRLIDCKKLVCRTCKQKAVDCDAWGGHIVQKKSDCEHDRISAETALSYVLDFSAGKIGFHPRCVLKSCFDSPSYLETTLLEN